MTLRTPDSVASKVWALGVRNSWTMTVDRVTGDVYMGEVTDRGPEEINVLRADGSSTLNFGWPYFEADNPKQSYIDVHHQALNTNRRSSPCLTWFLAEATRSRDGPSIVATCTQNPMRDATSLVRSFLACSTQRTPMATIKSSAAWETTPELRISKWVPTDTSG